MNITFAFRFSRKYVVGVAACLLALLGASSFTTTTNFLHAPFTNMPNQLPIGAPASISHAIGQDQTEYHIVTTSDDLRAENIPHALDAVFTAQGVSINSATAQWRLSLSSIGYGDAQRAVPHASPATRQNRVEYARGNLTEWYVNGPFGLEQGFTLDVPPGASNGQPLTLALALDGNVNAHVTADKRGLELLDARGAHIFQYSGMYANDSSGRELTAWLELQNSHLLVRVDDANAKYPIVIDPFVQKAKLYASDGNASAQLGESVAISNDGTIIVAGAPYTNVGANDEQGAVYVFVKPNSGWTNATQTAKLTASDGMENNWLGESVSISRDGATIIASATGIDNANGSSGAVYVFEKPVTGWENGNEIAKLTSSDDIFALGAAASISGDAATIVATADVNGYEMGKAYVFTKPVTGWTNATETATLTSTDASARDQFGISTALSDDGTTLIVGANFATINNKSEQGAAYIFVKPISGWTDTTESAKLTASTGAAGDWFGTSVAINGDGSTGVVEAPFADAHGVLLEGAAYVFERPANGWASSTQTATLTSTKSERVGDISISQDGNTIAALINSGDGGVYVFKKPANGWTNRTQSATFQPTDSTGLDSASTAIAIDGDGLTIALGAFGAKVNNNAYQGAVRAFEDAGCGAKPSKPTLIAPANNSSTKTRVTLKWQDVSCETQYQVFVKDSATNKNVFKINLGSGVTKVKTSALTKGKTYKWFIKACNNLGCTKSAARTFRVQ